MERPVVVLDNGAHTIKAGLIAPADTSIPSPRIIPNAMIKSKSEKKLYIGHEFENCRDFASLNYRLPFDKGYIVDWDAQKAVWDGLFSTENLSVATTESSILLTEPYFNLNNIQDTYDEFVFEEYEFYSYSRCTPAAVIPYSSLLRSYSGNEPECMEHMLASCDTVLSIDVGGKLLTNHLKELVSFRQWNMLDETYIMNHIKETCCYVSKDFNSDLETCRQSTSPRSSPILQEYVLPDLAKQKTGRIRQHDDLITEDDQLLTMHNERFSVPEILFRPEDIGLEQAGLAEAVTHSISKLPQDLQGMFWANIGLVGGNCKLPGLKERLFSELRTFAPIDCDVVIYESSAPDHEPYFGACNLIRRPEFSSCVVTRVEYQEFGHSIARRKFPDWKGTVYSSDIVA